MRHPAFDTNSDYASRKTESAELQRQQDTQQIQQAAVDVAVDVAAEGAKAYADTTVPGASGTVSPVVDAAADKAKDSASTDLSKTPTQPVLSSEVEAKLSAVQAATKSQLSAAATIANAENATKKANELLSSICAPIYETLDMLKELPNKLRSLVDIDSATVSMYSQLGKLQQTAKKINVITVSAEVPITLNDYTSSPTSYPKLEALQKLQNTVTEGDCLSSGYMKTQLSVSTSMSTDVKDIMQKPEEQGTVAKTCEQMFSSVVKPIWQTIATPVETIANIANIGPIGDMVQGVVDLVDGISQIAATPIPEDKLNEKISQHNLAGETYAVAADKVANSQSFAKETANDAIKNAQVAAVDAEKTLNEQNKAIEETAKDAFSSMKMPPMPDGLDESLKDLQDAIAMVVANMQNILIMALFKLLDSVFKCFNEIVGVIGVPSLPYPLNILPTLLMHSTDIMTFSAGLPMSLMSQVKAIAKRKVKATVVANLPPPPQPVEPIQQIEPTSEDVPMLDVTWRDVQDALVYKWKFSTSQAKDIVKDLQAFYDGSSPEESVLVLDGGSMPDSDKPNDYDHLWNSTKEKRYLLLPQVALEEFLPQRIQTVDDGNYINLPHKHSPNNKDFYTWKLNGEKWIQQYLDDPFQWEMYQYYNVNG